MNDDWTNVDTISICSLMSISDTSYFFDEPLVVGVPRGDYVISVRLRSVGGHTRVAAARASLSPDVSRGRKLGKVIIDFAQLGFCDRKATEQAFNSLADEEMSMYYDQLQTSGLFGRALLPGGIRIAYVSTGDGDGEYDVYELFRSDDTIAGVEVDFIENSDNGS